ncbi:MAG: LysM peptidoglycan-binding domain-containing protein [Myxococcota bacterium]
MDIDWALCVLASALSSSPAMISSQAMAQDPSPQEEKIAAVDLELFGVSDPNEESRERVVDEIPAALTSEVSPPPRRASFGNRDLSWLQNLEMPDIPIRWDERVVRYLEFFRDDPRGRNFIRAWMQRKVRYGSMIRKVLRELELPEDLLYVAMVESGFDPTAQSSAGAAGMWQFIESTGAEYGLTRDHWIDERLDPLKATRSGARYLTMLEQRFGSWELAFAAYNMGFGALLRSIRKYNTNDYWLLSRIEAGLPFETSVYVARIMACAIVGRNLHRFGLEDLPAEQPAGWTYIDVPGGISLRRLARTAELEPDVLNALNPELRRQQTPRNHDRYRLRIPLEARDRFVVRWNRQPRQQSTRSYQVRFGERLSHIATRFRTTARSLRQLNELEDDQDVGVGTVLLVPAVDPSELPGEVPNVAVPETHFSYPERTRIFYRIAAGDTLSEIAGFFRVSTDDLRRWNHVSQEAHLQKGMIMQLFVSRDVDLTQALVLTDDEVTTMVLGSEEFFNFHEQRQGRTRIRYTVRAGDTLSEIAERFGIDLRSLTRINRISHADSLQIGQELIVYVK